MQRKASKHHAAELLVHPKALSSPFTALFKHCKKFREGGLAISYANMLINIDIGGNTDEAEAEKERESIKLGIKDGIDLGYNDGIEQGTKGDMELA
eukprot:591567-Ditylum_brightwellii.AAC.1